MSREIIQLEHQEDIHGVKAILNENALVEGTDVSEDTNGTVVVPRKIVNKDPKKIGAGSVTLGTWEVTGQHLGSVLLT